MARTPKSPRSKGVDSAVTSLVVSAQLLSPRLLVMGKGPCNLSLSGARNAPSLSHPEPIFNKAAKIAQLERLFHRDLLGGSDGKNGGYVAKKNYTGCQSKFTLENTSSVQCFSSSSASMLLKSRWHFKTRFRKSSKWVSPAPNSFPSFLLCRETDLSVSISPPMGRLFILPGKPRAQPLRRADSPVQF